MNAVVMQNGTLNLERVPIPEPWPGEVLVKTLSTGICGSDLHALAHGAELVSGVKGVTGVELFHLDQPVVMGHEFCAEVVDFGPQTRKSLPVGQRIVSVPVILRPPAQHLLGYLGLDMPGAYAEYMVLSEDLIFPVPDHLDTDVATLTEPMSVALHAVNRGSLGARDVPIVIGCGPIGLAVIAILRMRGIGPIIAADFSPTRRAMAQTLGADVVVDPRESSPYDSWKSAATATPTADGGRTTTMFPDFADYRPSVVFECVGMPGVIQQILAGAAPCSKVVVAGVCMKTDVFQPIYALLKEIDLTFCMAYSADEFVQVLGHLVAGELQVDPLITSRIRLSEVPDAFVRLADPAHEAKVLVVQDHHGQGRV